MSDLSEREALSRFIEGLRSAEGSARIIAQYRRDERWVRVAGQIGELIEKSTKMAMARMMA